MSKSGFCWFWVLAVIPDLSNCLHIFNYFYFIYPFIYNLWIIFFVFIITFFIFFSTFSLKDKLRAILKATYTHSRNLACFVFTYKGLQGLQQKIQGKSLQSHAFLAACIGGWLVFGENNNINSQVWWTSNYKPIFFAVYCLPRSNNLIFVTQHCRSTCTCCPESCSPCLAWL